jgi:heme exporter protein A
MPNGNPETVQTVIETRGVTKRFGNRLVLKGIDLTVRRGELAVLFGPNGAGKTTLLRILATIMNPTAGTITIDGFSAKDDAGVIRRKIGVVSHLTFLYNDLTIRENLDFYARMYDVPQRKERIQETVEMVGMGARLNDRVGTLSRGMQQRVAIARAVLHQPEILLFDEPETGLDQRIISVLWDNLRYEKGVKRTIVLTTHDLDRGLELGERFLVLSRGTVVYDNVRAQVDTSLLRQTYEQWAGVAI